MKKILMIAALTITINAGCNIVTICDDTGCHIMTVCTD